MLTFNSLGFFVVLLLFFYSSVCGPQSVEMILFHFLSVLEVKIVSFLCYTYHDNFLRVLRLPVLSPHICKALHW